MRINFVVPFVKPTLKGVSGGVLCVYEYINGLAERGHDVSVVPVEFFGHPATYAFGGRIIAAPEKRLPLLKKKLKDEMYFYLTRKSPRLLRLLSREQNIPPEEHRRQYVRQRFALMGSAIERMPDCDANVATSYETVLPVHLSGKGVPFYFMQHFEEYFSVEKPDPDFARIDASLSYNVPVNKVANSTWLKGEIQRRYPHQRVAGVVNNAIRTDVFHPRAVQRDSARIRLLSYGGRTAPWKGIHDAAEAVRLVREKYPDVEWVVFGDSLLPADNDIAPYSPAGFLSGERLAELYSSCDIMLCTSWYESFPLFPLEAMACGLAVVTTPLGTEDYARDGENALIVPAQDPGRQAEAVISLMEHEGLRKSLGRAGMQTAGRFTWERAVGEFDELLTRVVSES